MDDLTTSGDDLTIFWWWKPECEAWHFEENPVVLSLNCPDGLKADWWK